MSRNILGIFLFCVFIIIIITGLIMFLTPHNTKVSSIHTLFGLSFFILVFSHLFNNKKILISYLKNKSYVNFKLNKSFFAIVLVLLFFIFGIVLNINGFNFIYNLGQYFKNNTERNAENTALQIINKMDKNIEFPAEIEIIKGKHFGFPIFAIWMEDSTGKYIKTLYISKSISSSTFQKGNRFMKFWLPASLRRPEALPYWSHKRNILSSDGLYIPMNNSKDLDAVSGPTPINSFVLKTNINNDCRILLEVNQSFDWNDFYSKNRYPDDKIYSGSGNVGQPALVYELIIRKNDLDSTNHFFLKLKGHSHHSGSNGKLYKDISKITTAKEIIDRIVVTVHKFPF